MAAIDYRVDLDRLHLEGTTGIFVRAIGIDGKWDSVGHRRTE